MWYPLRGIVIRSCEFSKYHKFACHRPSFRHPKRKLNSLFRKRVTLLLIFFIAWGGLITYRLYQTMISKRSMYLQRFEVDSWRTGTIPPLRGRILDKDGKPLAWSIRYFSLSYDVPENPIRFAEDAQVLGTILTNYRRLSARSLAGKSVVLKTDLSPGEILKLRPLIQSNNRFRIKSSFRREYLTHEKKFINLIGSTHIIDNVEVGTSGLERKYNFRLTGRDGKYRVMVDKNNNWIPATWEEIQAPRPGFDVYISSESE